MATAISVVTLLTDFGDRDYFVASMKGVILNINPQARIVDLTHAVPSYRVEEAAYLLKSCYHYFPDGTVHVAVVDPGVGSRRRPVLVSTSRYFFLAPDNGLLSYIYDEELSVEVRQIENRQYRLDSEGATFDGRDLFAPAAAWLTRGQAPGTYGRLIRDYVTLPIEAPAWHGPVFAGRIIYVDHFGNLISNVTPAHLAEVRRAAKRTSVTVRLAGRTIEDLVDCYADGSRDEPRALINSNGQLEVFVKEGHAADLLKVGRGERIEVY
ncbi:SAM hydrolase/SAM-dependent halogenase family protein [Candidatus Nitrospira bockiana]